jgi:hypothetical protein
MDDHGARPLDVDEVHRLRAIAQELTRTDPGLLRTAPPHDDGGGLRPWRVGASLTAICLLIGMLAVTLDALPALGAGAASLVVGTAACATHRLVRGRSAPGTR